MGANSRPTSTSARPYELAYKMWSVVGAVLLGCLVVLGPISLGNTIMVVAVGVTVMSLLRRASGTWFTPAGVMAGSWTLCLALTQLPVEIYTVPHQSEPLTLATYVVILLGVLAFAAGALIPTSRVPPGRLSVHPEEYRLWNAKALRAAVITCFILATIAFVIFVITAGAVPVLTEAPAISRGKFRLTRWGYLFSLYVPMIVFSALRIALHGGMRRNRIEMVLCSLGFLAMLSTGSRHDSFEAITLSVLAVRFAGPRRPRNLQSVRRIRLAVALVVVAIGFFAVGSARDNGRGGLAYEHRGGYISIENRALAEIFVYASGLAPKNLQYGLQQPNELQYGRQMLRFPLGWVGDPPALPDYWPAANTVTFLWNYLIDFGLPGIVLLPFGVGLLSGMAYARARYRRTIISQVNYAVLALCTIWSTSTERFFEPITVYYFVVFGLFTWYCKRHASKTPSPPASEPDRPAARPSPIAPGPSWR